MRNQAGIGLFGGTFDPPHIGHIVAAVAVRHALGLDRVLMTVANRPWQKVGTRPISAASDRLALVTAACAEIDGLEASTIEIDRGGDSFTADTLAEVRSIAPDAPLFVVVGSDAAAGVTTWARADEVRDRATMVLVDRPGLSAPPLPHGWDFVRVDIPRLDVSSTDLRRRVASGEPIAGLVPPGVRSVIEAAGLYR